MPVDTNHWRAAIASFRLSLNTRANVHLQIKPLSTFLSISKLYIFCCIFVLISIPVLPLTLVVQIAANFSFYPNNRFMHVFAWLYSSVKAMVYVFFELIKRFPFLFLDPHKRTSLKFLLLRYAYFYAICLVCYTLHLHWTTHKAIMMSGDVETNPGPDHSTFSFCSWNLNSICAHDFARVSQIEAYNSVYNYDLIGTVETHLDDTVEVRNLDLTGYTFMKSNHPDNVKRGGVGLYVKDSFPAKSRQDLASLPECIVCEVQLDKKKYFFAILYRSPSQSQAEFQDFMNNFELMLSRMSSENPYCVIITGDFNCRATNWWENDIENDEGKLFEPLTADLGLHQLINEPTHLIGNSRSCIDIILTDQPNLFLESGVHPSLHENCHHQIIFGKLSAKKLSPPPYKRRIWYYDRANVIAIKKSIEMFPWSDTFSEVICPDLQVKTLNEILLNIFSNFIPNKIITVRSRRALWMTQSIKNFIQKKNRAYNTFIRNGQPEDRLEAITNMISQGSKLIEDAKDKYFTKIGRTLSNPDTGKKLYWSLINKILNKAKIPIIPPLLENDVFVLDFTAKAEIFNDYFIQQCTTINTGSELPPILVPNAPLLTDVSISDEKILNIIRSLNPNKAHGWDDISVRMIKICDDALLLPLSIIFESCMSQGVFPEVWKQANVVPIHKKNSKNLKQNYRPISLLPIFGKILEKLIFDSLYQHLNMNSLLNPNQSGFRPGDSTVNQLLSIVHSIYTAFNCNPTLDVRSVYLDISKAFDRVWHQGLIYKLRRCGVSGKLLTLMQSFLENRKQRTVLNGKTSTWSTISAGVPQGSILGPLFFLIYINDLTDGLKCNVKLFADDTSIFTVVHDPHTAALDMNHDLNLIKLWAHSWRMSFNPDPTKQAVEVTFSKKRIQTNHPPIFFNGAPVMRVQEQKHLGVILDSKQSFASHIQSVISKCRQGIGMLRFLSKYLPRHTLNEMYKLYVRPHLDYGDIIYHIPQNICEFSQTVTLTNLMEKLESVQYSAALAVTGAWKGTSRQKIYDELGWESLNFRRWSRRLVLFYKIINNLTPDYTRSPVPQLQESDYSLRRRAAVGQIRARTERFKSSFYPNCLSEWEKLDPEIRQSCSVNVFKKRLLAMIRPPSKKIYNIHDPKGLSILTQLHVGLSMLNFHKFKHNFSDTLNPLCPINDGIEDTEHFLLLCHAYDQERRDLLNSVNATLRPHGLTNLTNETLLQLLLYGHEKLSFDLNTKILEATLNYIHASERFQ